MKQVFARRLAALEGRSFRDIGLLGLVVAGYLLRVVVCLLSEGSNDIRTWNDFARSVVAHGLKKTYVLYSGFNHPPLMGLWGAAALKLSQFSGIRFDQVFKLPALVAELVTGFLLYAAWRRRHESLTGLRAFALYATSLSVILISAYHGNTDAIYFCLAFLAADLLERRSPFWSGFALGAAVNVKLIPVLIGLPLASRCRDRRELVRFVLGGLSAMTPFAVLMLAMSSAERHAFIQNVFLYRSMLEIWGTELFARVLIIASEHGTPALALWIRHFADHYSLSSGSILIVGSAGIAAWQLWFARRKLSAYALTTLGFASFLLFGAGFGVQYLGCVIAPLLACSLGYGALVSALFGLTTLFIYWNFVVQWSPVYSSHYINWRYPSTNSALPAEFGALTVLCWFALGAAAVHLLRPTLPVVWPHPFRFARRVPAGAAAGAHSPEAPDAAPAATPASRAPSAESSALARLREWFSRRHALGTALDLAGTPERREWRRRARLAFDHATRVHEPAEPFGLGASPVVASELYREACYWAIAASSAAVTSLPSREELLGKLDRALVKRALESDEAVERFQTSLARPWFGDYAPGAPEEQALAAAELARGARALVEAAEAPERKLETLRAERLVRFATPVVVLAALALFVPPLVSDWLDERHDLAAGKRWRTSSQWGAPCDPERGRCAGATGTRILFHTNEESSPWVEFDLGRETVFSKVKVRNRTDCCAERAVPLVLEISHDRKNWREIARRHDPFETWTAHFARKRARYLRARVLGKTVFHLERVMILE